MTGLNDEERLESDLDDEARLESDKNDGARLESGVNDEMVVASSHTREKSPAPPSQIETLIHLFNIPVVRTVKLQSTIASHTQPTMASDVKAGLTRWAF